VTHFAWQRSGNEYGYHCLSRNLIGDPGWEQPAVSCGSSGFAATDTIKRSVHQNLSRDKDINFFIIIINYIITKNLKFDKFTASAL